MTTAVETAHVADRFPGARVVAGCFIVLDRRVRARLLRARRLPQRLQPRARLAGGVDLAGHDGVLRRRRRRRRAAWPGIIARRDVRIVDRRRRRARRRRPGAARAGRGALAAVRRLRRLRARVRRRRPRPGDDGRDPLVPRAPVGRPVGRVDRALGRRHPASRRSPSGSSTTAAWRRHADPRCDLGRRHRPVRRVARAARSGRARLAPRRRAGPARRARRSCRRGRRSTTPCEPASSSPSPSATCSCSAPRSAASSSSSSSSRSAPTARPAALATIGLAGTSVVARLAGGRVVARLPMAGFTAGLAAVQALALAAIAFADRRAWPCSPRSSCSARPSATS